MCYLKVNNRDRYKTERRLNVGANMGVMSGAKHRSELKVEHKAKEAQSRAVKRIIVAATKETH